MLAEWNKEVAEWHKEVAKIALLTTVTPRFLVHLKPCLTRNLLDQHFSHVLGLFSEHTLDFLVRGLDFA